MAQNNTITFYDLTMAHGATTSPFVWATKYALKHKGFDLDVVPGGFTGIPERTGGKTERLPAIVDDGKWVLDSWGIVEYLDEAYPDRPALIPHPSVAIVTRALDAWFWQAATGPWARNHSYTAATPHVVNTTGTPPINYISRGDVLRIDVDTAGSGAKGLEVLLEFGPNVIRVTP